MSNIDIDKLGYGPLNPLTAFLPVSNPAVGTAPVNFRPLIGGVTTWPVGLARPPKGVKVKILNGHASQAIGYAFTPFGAAAPSITADFVAATPSSIIGPGFAAEFFALWWNNDAASGSAANPGWDLWVVASGATTPVNVTFDIIT